MTAGLSVELLDKVRSNFAERALAGKGDALLLAVSGGLDSMAMLHLLNRMAPELDLRLVVAHFNHRLRGAESDGDETFVRETAGRMGLMFIGGAGDVAGAAAAGKVSIEMAARRLRHEFLARAAAQTGAGTIVLAHHADDQVETFWLRLLRGQVGPGLAGMLWKAPSPADASLRLIRPLLDVWRREIEEYARRHAVTHREDSSNAQLRFQRNRLRHEVLPVLESFQPQLREISLRAIEVLGAEKDFLREAAGRQEDFAGAHPAVQREMLRQMLAREGVEASFDLIEMLRRSTDPAMVEGGRQVARQENGRIALRGVEPVAFDPAERVLDVSEDGAADWAGVRLEWKHLAAREPKSEAGGLEQFDADAIGTQVVLRHWRPGDRFQPIGMAQAAKLQDIFTNLKVPEAGRHRRIVAVREGGEIFWVEGMRIGEIAKLQPGTRRVLRWSWKRA